MNIAVKLIRGSQELNRMEQETKMLVGMLLSMVERRIERSRPEDYDYKDYYRYPLDNFVYDHVEVIWQIERRGDDRKLHARCFKDHRGKRALAFSTDRYWYCSGLDEEYGGVATIKFAYDALVHLVNRFTQKHFIFDSELQPFLEAADR